MTALTPGSIMSIASGKVDLKPVVQVIDINKIVSNQSGGQDRYRLILSDGQHFQQAMLATNLNGLVVQQEIVNLCTVRLVDFICKPIKDRRILIVLNLEMVGGPEGKVGNPTSVDQAMAGGAKAAPAASAPPAHLKSDPMQISRAPQTVEAGQLAGQSIFPISGLNPYQNKWTIRARVTKKNHRPYTNQRGSGTLINVDLLDSEGGEIRATAFNEVAERMNAVFEENKVFLVSMGEVKFANKRFNPLNNDYEITMNNNTVVEMAQDDPTIPQVQYNFVPIAGIEDIPKDRNVDIIGALVSVEEIGSITTKNNDQLNKRTIVLADDSNASINATLWGQRAEEFNLPTGTEQIVAIKGARVGDYGGRTLSVNSNSTFAPNPDIPEAFKQKGWYDDCGGQGVRSLSSTYSGGGSSAPLESVNLSEIPARVSSGAPFKLKTVGSITYVPSNNDLWYEACPGPDPKDPNRLCNKKIFKNNTQYVCDKCDGAFDKPNLRYICSFKMSDFSGEQWMTAFNEVAEQVLGMDAEAMKNLKENGDDASFRRALVAPQFNTYSLRCNASLDTNGDNGPRIRCTIQGITPLNYVQQSWDILKEIKRLEAL